MILVWKEFFLKAHKLNTMYEKNIRAEDNIRLILTNLPGLAGLATDLQNSLEN